MLFKANLSNLLPPAPASNLTGLIKATKTAASEEEKSGTSTNSNSTLSANETSVALPPKKTVKPHVVYSAEDLKDIDMSTDEVLALKLPKTKSSMPPTKKPKVKKKPPTKKPEQKKKKEEKKQEWTYLIGSIHEFDLKRLGWFFR